MDSQSNSSQTQGTPERRIEILLLVLGIFFLCVVTILAITAINVTFGSNVLDADTARTLIAIFVSVALATLIFALFRTTVATFKWQIPGGPALELSGAAALSAAFYFMVVAQFDPTTHLSLLLTHTDGKPFHREVEVFARLDATFYHRVYDPRTKSVTFFYVPKGTQLEFGLQGDSYVIERIGGRTDKGCKRLHDYPKVVQLTDNCHTVEVIVNNRGLAENIGIKDLVIAMPIVATNIKLGNLLDLYPLRRIRSELERLGTKKNLQVIYKPESTKQRLYEEDVYFNLVDNGNTKACTVIDAILSEYRKTGKLSTIGYHVTGNALTIYLGENGPDIPNDCP